MITKRLRQFTATAPLLGLLFACMAINATAETRYVTDILQLSLHEQINSQGKLLQRLNSGTELELLEISGFYARVRTQDGVEGWTKAGFLISEKPARTQLANLLSKNASLQQQLATHQQDLNEAKTELTKVLENKGKAYAEMAQRAENAEQLSTTVETLQEQNEAFRRQLSGYGMRIPAKWGMIAAGVSLLLGIGAGIALFDYRSRRRHGGYRIY
jgi:SH3 domain protein